MDRKDVRVDVISIPLPVNRHVARATHIPTGWSAQAKSRTVGDACVQALSMLERKIGAEADARHREAEMEKEGKIKLGSIEVKMGPKTVTLTVDQARELCALLKGLFGDDATKIVHVHDHYYPRPWYGWTYTGYQWNAAVTSQSNAELGTVTYTLNGT